jgi:hypothetical protein
LCAWKAWFAIADAFCDFSIRETGSAALGPLPPAHRRSAGTFPLRDSDGNTINAKRRLVAQLTIKDGRVWYERPSE